MAGCNLRLKDKRELARRSRLLGASGSGCFAVGSVAGRTALNATAASVQNRALLGHFTGLPMASMQLPIQATRVAHRRPVSAFPPHWRLCDATVGTGLGALLVAAAFAVLGETDGTLGLVGAQVEAAGVAVVVAVGGFAPKGR